MTRTTVLDALGDSLFEGDAVAGVQTSEGGRGALWELLAGSLGRVRGVGPLLSPGIRSIYQQTGEWSSSGSWSTVQGTDAFDVVPYGGSVAFSSAGSAGTGLTRTWTKPARWPPLVGWAPVFTDLSLPNDGSWSYSADNNASWTDHGQTLAGDAAHASFYVASAMTSNVRFRSANAAGSARGSMVWGVIPFFLDPRTTDGFILNNLAKNGFPLADFMAVTAGGGRHSAILDGVKVDPVHGNGMISLRPNGVLMGHGNDIRIYNDTSKWDTDVRALKTRCDAVGARLGVWSPYELGTTDPPGYPSADQTAYRAQTVTTCAAIGVSVLDLFARWQAMGLGGAGAQYAKAVAQGFINGADNGHQFQAGHTDLVQPFIPFVRGKILVGVGTDQPVTPSRAAAAAPVARSKVAPASRAGLTL